MTDNRRGSLEATGTPVDAKTMARNAKAERDREIKEVRTSDLEPYTGLRYLSKLFRFMGVILVMLLVAEVATGVYTQGSASIPTLLGEASRLIVLAGVLWGTGDLALLLIDVGHDVRANRILTARVAHSVQAAPLTTPRTVVAPAETRQLVGTATPVVNAPLADRSLSRRNFADRVDNGDDDGPPIP